MYVKDAEEVFGFLMVWFQLHHLTLLLLVWRNVPFVIVMALYVHQCALLWLITMLILHVYVLWSQILLLQP